MGDNLPTVDLGAGRTATAIATGWESTCALLDNRQVKCWGFNGYGELGQGDRIKRGDGPGEMGDNLPPVDLGTGRTATAITANKEGTRCALLDNGQVKCWGSDGGGGLLGASTRGSQNIGDEPGEMGDNLPAVDLGTGRTAVAVSAGEFMVCALLDNGQVKCWGRGGYLGLGDTQSHGSGFGPMGDGLPAVDLGTGRTARAISAGFDHTCALLDNGGIKCWGAGLRGALGLGDTRSRGANPGEMGDALPVVDLGTGRTAISVSSAMEESFTCAVLDNAQVKCWGAGFNGELGAGSTTHLGDGPGEMGDNLPAVDLGMGRTARMVSAGSSFACALLDNGRIKCWGDNGWGQLGLGSPGDRGDGAGEMGDNLPAVDLGTHRDRLVDAEVKRSTDAGYVGAGTYNTTGAGQTVGADVVREQTASFNVRFTNRSTGTDSITVHGEGGQADYGVTWLNGNTDVTNAVVSGTHVFGNVAPGATVNLTLLVNVGATATNGQQLTVHVQGASSHDPTKVDTAGATVTAVVPPYSIDAGVKRSADSSYTGANTYNGTGAGQTVAANVVRGAGTTFDVQFTNRSTLVDSITVQGEGSVANFPVTYRVGGADVTAAVVAGTQRFDNVASGANVTMTVQIGVGAGATAGTSRTVHVRGTSTHDATKSDTVGATVTATDTFMVDSQIRRSGTATFVGTDTYNTTGVGQKVKSDVRRRQTGTFDVRFTNRSTATDTITVHGNAGATGFKVRYFDGATEVTNQVVAGTYHLTNVPAGGSRTLTVRIKVKAGTALGAATTALVTGTSTHDPSKVDAVKAKVRAVA